MNELALAFTLFLLMPLSIMWRGYVLSVLWGWFAVPFFGLPTLGTVQCMGVILIVTFLTHQSTVRSKDRENAFAKAVGIAFLVPALDLLIGWILLHWL